MDTTGILSLFILAAAVIYLFYGIILAYHWIRFSSSWSITAFSLGIYSVGGIYIIGIMMSAVASI